VTSVRKLTESFSVGTSDRLFNDAMSDAEVVYRDVKYMAKIMRSKLAGRKETFIAV